MGLSEVQTFGYGRSVRELIVKNRRDLEAGGMDVDRALEALDEAQAAAERGNALQEERKRLLKEATDGFLPEKARLYHVTSNVLDMAVAAVGKETVAGQTLRRVRTDMKREAPPGAVAETPDGPSRSPSP